MKRKLFRFSVALLVLCATLLSCANSKEPTDNKSGSCVDTEGQYVSGQRQGNLSQSLRFGNKIYEYTDDGIYYFQQTDGIKFTHNDEILYLPCDVLYFSEHGTDTMIRLCGRPDCTHDSPECNAVFQELNCSVSSYGGHIYVAGILPGTQSLFNVYRLNPDGSNRLKVLDGAEINTKGYQVCSVVNIVNGVLVFDPTYIDSNGNNQVDYFYYKLDGSMKKPEQINDLIWRQDGDTLLMTEINGLDDKSVSYMCSWDPDTNTTKQLYEVTGIMSKATSPVYYSENSCYYIRDGMIYSGTAKDEEALFYTGYDGEVRAKFFPYCVVVIIEDEDSPVLSKLVFFDWEGNNLGELVLGFEYENLSAIFTGETHERILLTPSWSNLPKYYIEKSDFGTGTIELNDFKYPDMDVAEYERLFYIGE